VSDTDPRSPLDLLGELKEKGVELSSEEELLLGTDGSVTFLLEVLTGREVLVETLEQRLVEASEDQAEALGVKAGDEVNLRRVVLRTDRPLVYAESLTPVKRLEPEFYDKLLREDKPIGRIMAERSIEARRDLREMGTATVSKGCEVLDVDEVLYRVYDVVRNGEVLMNIREEFPSGQFD